MVVMLIPLLKVLTDSLDAAPAMGLNFIPREFTLGGYKSIIKNVALRRPFLISLYVTVVGTALGLALTTIAAYVLIQKKMPGRTFFVFMIFFTMIFDGGLIPRYMTIKNIGMLNHLSAVIIPICLQTYNIILMKNFFNGIPESLFEAAEIDGCSPFGMFWRIALPMSTPALASIGLFVMVNYWNEFMPFILYINDDKLYNFQVKLREMVLTDDSKNAGSAESIYGKTLQNATIIASMLPVMIVYPFLQKYFVTGITMGAVKE
jgi:putative aldouronate transport system permease protein